jgi:hypothetical protein
MADKSPAQVAAEAEASDELAAERLRLNEQVALMINADQLIKSTAAKDSGPIEKKEYKHFATFRGSPGSHIALTNNLYRNESIQYIFSEVDNASLSTLVPSIEIYKVFYPKKESNSRGFSWRVPFDDIPTPFSNQTSPYVNNTLNEILSGDGRMHGVGIRSFRYKFVGTNPAEVNTNIEAELELYFQDVRDLVKRIYFNKKDKNFDYEPDSEPTMDPDTSEPAGFSFSYSDLAIDSPMNFETKSTDGKPVYNERYFRLKIILGYSDSYDIIEKIYADKPEVAEKLKKAIKSAKLILYLNPFSHDIQFEEDGSVILKIQFIAAMTSIMNNINALAIGKDWGKLKEEQEKFDSSAYAEKARIEEIKKDCSISEDQRQKRVDNEQKKIDTALEQQKTQLENNKNIFYQELFRMLVGVTDGPSGMKPKIYSAMFDQYAIGAKPSIGSDEVLENPNQLRIKNIKSARSEDVKKTFTVDSITESDIPLAGSTADGVFTSPTARKAGEKFAEEIGKKSKTSFSDEDGKYKIKFVFLGDIIDVFASNVITVDAMDRPRIILSNFRIEIPVAPAGDLAQKSLEDKTLSPFATDAEYTTLDLNIADIPISVEMLQGFMIEKIIKPRRTSYPLTNLINDIMTDVVIPSISPSVFGRKTVLNKAVRLSSLSITLPFKGVNDPIFESRNAFTDNFYGTIDNSLLDKIKVHDSTLNNLNQPFGNYFIMYCSNQLPSKIFEGNGVEQNDIRNGVYHFFIGSDKGLIKKITFSKQDAPFNKEAKAAGSTGDKSLGRLREVYDTSIVMFGNNIYRPGDFIYVEPLFFTREAAINLQNKLGLGGYYQVIDVSTTINENIFETTLRCAIAGYVDGTPPSTVREVDVQRGGC